MTGKTLTTTLNTLFIALLLSACNENDHDPAATQRSGGVAKPPTSPAKTETLTVTITPSLGRISNARVILRNARNGSELGRSNTGLAGQVQFTIAKTVDTVIVEVIGGAGSSYFDEAKGEQPLPDTASLRAAAPVANNSNIGVSILTEAAVQKAEDLSGGLTNPANIAAANKDIGAALGIADITRAPTLIGSAADLSALGASPADQYALQLAGLVKTAAAHTISDTPALELINTLASDLKDTVIDGKSGETPIANPPYPTTPSVFQADWQFGMTGIVNALTNEEAKTTLKTEVINTAEVKDPVSGPIVDGGGVFGGDDKKPWKGRIYQLPNPTHSQPDFSLFTPTATLYTDNINIADREFSEGFPGFPELTANFGLVYTGPLTVEKDGQYLFRIGSDDGSLLFIDDNLVINNSGDHSFRPIDSLLTLRAGVHTLRVDYYQGPPTRLGLQLWVLVPGVGTPTVLTPTLAANMAQP